jgi:hypothetical protein
MGLIGSKPEFAYSYFDQAARALNGDKNFAKSDRDALLARITVHKIRTAMLAGDMKSAHKWYAEMELTYKKSMDPVIQAALKGGRGAVLYGEKKYMDAVTELQDDEADAFSQMLLAKSFRLAGKADEAKQAEEHLLTLHRLEIDLWLAQQGRKA